MKLYILRWNPNISSYKTETHLQLINHLEQNQMPTSFNWSIREHEQLEKDDMFILQQVGTEHDGIAMIGKFRDKCYEDDSWRKDSKKVQYADMWIMDAFDCNSNNPLPAEKYEELFPEVEWHGGHSGVLVKEDLDDKIVDQIEKDLIEAKIWDKDELNKFLTWDFEAETPDGKYLLQAKELFLKDSSEENLAAFITCLLSSEVLIPMHVEKDPESKTGENRFYPMILTNDDGSNAIPIFSNEEQLGDKYQEDDCEVYGIPITVCVDILGDDKTCDGLILDPFTTPFLVDNVLADLIKKISATKD